MRHLFPLFALTFLNLTYGGVINDITRWWEQINATYQHQMEEKNFNIYWWNNACSNYPTVSRNCKSCVSDNLQECKECYQDTKEDCDKCISKCLNECKNCLDNNGGNETECASECNCQGKCSNECDFAKKCTSECNCFADCSEECEESTLTETCYNICSVGHLYKENFFATPPIVRPFIAPSVNLIVDYKQSRGGLRENSILLEIAKQKQKAELTGSCDYLIVNNGVPASELFKMVEPASQMVKCQKVFVIYATDHTPKDLDKTVDEVGKLYQNNKTMTFALGIETSSSAPNQIAQAGGTDKGYYPLSPQELKDAIADIFQRIKRIQAGNFAGIANVGPENLVLIQPLFYPVRKWDNLTMDYPGFLISYWYYLKLDQIREDTNRNKALDIDIDNILKYQNTESGELIINRYDPYGGLIDTLHSFEETNRLVDFGEKLKETSPDERTIYVNLNGSLEEFTTALTEQLKPYFGLSTEATEELIEWVRGKDFSDFRSRTLSDGKTWKLGDIVDSKPLKVDYNDTYTVIYVASNDGMLHAFKLGYLWSTDNVTLSTQARLFNSKTDSGTDTLGKELWAFIPKNALPYLPYVAKKYYRHLYVVDLSPYLVEDGNRKILIGGMGFGGATGYPNGAKPPIYACPNPQDDSCVGRSSYFALDITDPTHPKLLWEFTHKYLGLTISGPAIVKRGKKTYVVFVNGPEFTNATVTQDDINNSDLRKLRVFVLDLNNGTLLKTLELDTPGPAFGGRLFKKGYDYDGDGNTDFVLIGYSFADGSPKNWKGGIAILYTQSDNPANWTLNKLPGDINPVTSQILVATCMGKPYAFFGTGRWFFKTDDLEVLNVNSLYGVPINCSKKDGNFECNWEGPNSATDVTNQKNAESVCEEYKNGHRRAWKIDLEPAEDEYLKEKDISDPSAVYFSVNGTPSSAILFTTSQPYKTVCSVSAGRSRLWFVNCLTGAGTFSDICPETNPNPGYFCVVITVNTTPGAGGGEGGETPVEIIPLPLSYCTSVLLATSGGQIHSVSLINLGKNRVSNWFGGGVAAAMGATFSLPSGSKASPTPSESTKGIILLWLEF